MTTIRFIGDLHGNMKDYHAFTSSSPYPSIQLGDMGVGFCQSKLIYENVDQNRHRFIRGNHDNPNILKDFPNFISDGLVETLDNGMKIMYIGGAASIDAFERIEGINWWPNEELTYSEFMTLMDIYEKVKPDILVSHDIPKNVACKMFNKNPYYMHSNITSQAFESFFDIHKPKYWIFGHWHMNKIFKYKGTIFICIDKNDYKDICFNGDIL